MSKIGDDVMGDRLERSFREQGVDICGLLRDPRYFTTMTFVELSPEGERSFSFARQFGADAMLYPEELPMDVIRDCRIFHYSGMALNQSRRGRRPWRCCASSGRKAGTSARTSAIATTSGRTRRRRSA